MLTFTTDEVGNAQLPKKLQAVKRHRAQVRWAAVAIGLVVVAALAAAVFSFLRKAPARSLATAVEKSIAVLPFENLSEEKANAFFADGVQDEILTDLARDCRLESHQPHERDAVQERRRRAICARSASSSAWRMSSKAACNVRPTRFG